MRRAAPSPAREASAESGGARLQAGFVPCNVAAFGTGTL
jgi:hypothetical protein